MLRKTGVHFPYNRVFAGMCLIVLPATPTLAGTADNSSLITISTERSGPFITATGASAGGKTTQTFLTPHPPQNKNEAVTPGRMLANTGAPADTGTFLLKPASATKTAVNTTAPGASVFSTSTSASNAIISTLDAGDPGVLVNAGSVTLTESAILTAGNGSAGIVSSNAGTVEANRTLVATAGLGAAGAAALNGNVTLTESAVLTAGDGGAGLFSANGGTISATHSAIATAGAGGAGVAAIAGNATLTNSKIRTVGEYGAGIFAAAGSAINATATSVITSGDNAMGVFSHGSTITLSDGPVSTSGTGSTGLFATAEGRVEVTYTEVTTTGDNAEGVFANNGVITLTDSTVDTRGSHSHGIFSRAAGSVDAANTTIVTTGESASGVFADSGSVTLSDSSVNTRASNSHGIFSGAAGSVDAANTTIVTAGDNANGVFADSGSVTLSDSSVSTRASNSHGIFSGAAGSVDAANTTIVTTGESANGVFADSGSVTLSDSSVNTRASNSHGIFSGAGSTVDATTTNVITAGENAHALFIEQGAVSITDGALISGNAAAIFATGNNAAQQAGEVTLNNVTVTAAQSSVVSSGGMLNLHATGTTFNSETGTVLDVRSGSSRSGVFSNVALNADNSILNGSLVSDNTQNTSDVTLSNNSSLIGHSQNISSLALDGTSKWYMSANSDVQSLTNNGTIIFSEPTGDDYKTLTVNGNYAGNGGLLIMNTQLGDDASPTDRLIVTGNVEAGDTLVSINNMGGQGAGTVEGIEVVSVGGVSEGRFLKSGRIVAGAYDYDLEKVNESWYLTSKSPYVVDPGVTPPDTTDPTPGPGSESQYRPETGAYLANLLAANTMFEHRMQDRLGEGSYARSAESERADGLWIRHVGGHNRFYDDSGQLKARTNRYVLQLGVDLAQWSADGNDRLHVGVMGGYGNAQSNIRSALSGYRADSTIEGYSAGVYATWVESAKDMSGAYVDGWLLYNWLRNTISGEQLASEHYDSKGVTASLEAGYTLPVTQGERVSSWLQPKVQLTWMGVSADSHREHNGTWVTDETDGVLRSRVGMRAYLKGHSQPDSSTGRDFQPFVEANWLHNFNDYSVKMDDVTNSIAGNKNVGELKLGVEGKIANDFTLWGNVAQQVGSDGYSDTSVIFGSRLNFR